jgi:hypothetical protein
MEACLFWPTTMQHSTMAAPELSMQLSIVCGNVSQEQAFKYCNTNL